MDKSLLETLGPKRVNELMDLAVQNAIAEAHAKGFPVTGDVNGVISTIYPDGRVEKLEIETPSIKKYPFFFMKK